MEDEERKQQLLEVQIRHAQKELQRPQPPYWFEFSCIGCFIGGLLGPAFLIGLLSIDAYLHPHDEAGGILGYLLLFIMSVPIGGVCCAILSPLLFQLFRRFLRARIQKNICKRDFL